MDASDWDKLQRIFHTALALEPSQRPAYLSEVCFDDPALRTRLERMLESAHNDPLLPLEPSSER